MELVIFTGLQASGKSTFFDLRFSATHLHVGKDLLARGKGRDARQLRLVEDALSRGRSVVVDNTNPDPDSRRELIRTGRRLGARVVSYYFESSLRENLERNRGRPPFQRVPDIALYATAKRLVPPAYDEGFDEIYRVESPSVSNYRVTAVPRPSRAA